MGNEIADIQKKIQECETHAEAVYSSIGKKYYSMNTQNPEEAYYDDFNEMKNIVGEINALKCRLNFLKGIVICDSCETENSTKNSFCIKCGSRLPHTFANANGANKCPKCGMAVVAGSRFCSACGSEVEYVEPKEEETSKDEFCPNCGKVITGVTDPFCTHCGAKIR